MEFRDLYDVFKADGGKQFHIYFPLTLHPTTINCWNEPDWEDKLFEGEDIRMINEFDSDEILKYISISGAGSHYSGMVGTVTTVSIS